MPGLGGLNSFLEQTVIFNIAGTLIGAALTPYTQALSNTVWATSPNVPLSPADLAAAVIRGEMDESAAASEALMSGVNNGRFHTLVRLSGDAPGPGDLADALRRGFIDEATYERGVAQGRMRTEWGPLVKKLAVRDPSPTDALGALLEGQLDDATARKLYADFGGNPEHFTWLYNAQGSAPTPTQAAEMANRGIIPWAGQGPDVVSFEQAFLEGPWRNKWSAPFQKYAKYVPPPRTVTAMYNEGSITREQAIAYLKAAGCDDATAAAMLVSGSSQKTAKTKDLAQSTVLALYHDRLISRADAASALGDLKYDTEDADFILAVEDARVFQSFLSSAVGRVHTLYVSHKIDRAAMLAALSTLGVDKANVGDLSTLWDLERSANVHTLTPADISAAVKLTIITPADGLVLLQEQGYQPHDAWTYLYVHTKSKPGDEPAKDSILGPATTTPGA